MITNIVIIIVFIISVKGILAKFNCLKSEDLYFSKNFSNYKLNLIFLHFKSFTTYFADIFIS